MSSRGIFLAFVCCAMAALEVNSSPLRRVSVGVAVEVPPRFQQSRQFTWNSQDGLAEVGPAGNPSLPPPEPLEDLQYEGITEDEPAPVVGVNEDLEHSGPTGEDIERRIENTSASEEEIGSPGPGIPDEEEDIQIQEPREDDIESPGVESDEEHREESPDDQTSSPEENEPGPLASLLNEATANLEAKARKGSLGYEALPEGEIAPLETEEQFPLPAAAEQAVSSSVPAVAEAETIVEEPLLTQPEPAFSGLTENEIESSPEEAELGQGVEPGEYEDASSRRKRASGSEDDLLAFREEARDQFNIFRNRAGMADVTLDDELNDGAQSWAEHMLESGSTAMSDCEDCVYIETFAHKKLTSSRRDLPTGAAAGNWVITRWFRKAANDSNDPYSKALLRRESISNIGIGVAYSRIGDRKEMFVVARFE